MNINYIIAAYNCPGQLERLIERLNAPGVRFYLHIDKKVDIKPFRDALGHVPNLRMVDDDHRVVCRWGGIGIVHAALRCMRYIVEERRDGHCVFLSGQDYPLVSNASIAHFFEQNKTKNFISADPLPKDDWLDGGWSRLSDYHYQRSDEKYSTAQLPSLFDPAFYKGLKSNVATIVRLLISKQIPYQILKKRDLSRILRPYGGHSWWALPVQTVQEMLQFLDEDPGYLAFFDYVHVPDEIIFQSLVRELVPEGEILPSLTYTNWDDSLASPRTFTCADFEELQNLGGRYLYARKFSEMHDERVMSMIDDRLL
ncbi:MAG: beta-1,6-N-acetylglucosaminyltransferase [Akkermansiaceae bacterium]